MTGIYRNARVCEVNDKSFNECKAKKAGCGVSQAVDVLISMTDNDPANYGLDISRKTCCVLFRVPPGIRCGRSIIGRGAICSMCPWARHFNLIASLDPGLQMDTSVH